jgi:hypothetical protein
MSGRRAARAAAAVSAEADEGNNSGCDQEQRGDAATRPAPSCPPARLFDQRLKIGDALLEVAILLDLGPAGRCRNGHDDTSCASDAKQTSFIK